MAILHEIFYRPLFNALFFLYETVAAGDLGLAIVGLTLLVRLILYPVFQKSVKNQTIMQKLQPKIKELQAKHKDNREEQARVLMQVYKEHNVNPFSGFLLILVQLPVFIGLYSVFSQKFAGEAFSALYSFVPNPGEIDPYFLGLINLYESSIVLVVLAALFQYLQGYYSLPKTSGKEDLSAMERASRQMVFIAPAVSVAILWNLPSAVALYWAVSSLISVMQQVAVNRSLKRQKI